jgi:periplasmic protein TonB
MNAVTHGGSARRPSGLGTRDELPSSARRLLVAAVVTAHAGGIYGLLQISAVREAVRDAVPIFAGLIQPAPPAPEPPAPAPRPVIPSPVQRAVPAPIVAAPPAPQPAPAEFVVEAPPPQAIVAPEVPAAPPSPPGPSAPVQQPRTLSVTDVGYLTPPRIVYPSLARRLGEEGRVTLRVLVDPGGVPAQILVASTSGYTRLDTAAVEAIRRTRFRPYSEDGFAQTVWVLVPFVFALEAS